jgi:c-di-GMP-binding flagellar brake protein YcgR
MMEYSKGTSDQEVNMEGSSNIGQGDRSVKQNTAPPQIIPFQFGASLMLKSLTNLAHKAKAKVLGVIPDDFIIIEKPVFAVNERLSASISGDFLCVYCHDGCVYKFRSRFREVPIKNIVCIEFPIHFEAQQLRKYPRVKVNLEAEIAVANSGQFLTGDITDISEGGCCLEFPSLIPVVKGAVLDINFTLPDNQMIEHMQCTVMNTNYSYAWRRTQFGVSFAGPGSEIDKIGNFCRMCSYFRV